METLTSPPCRIFCILCPFLSDRIRFYLSGSFQRDGLPQSEGIDITFFYFSFHHTFQGPGVILKLCMIQPDQFLFLSRADMIRLIIHQDQIFVLLKIGVDDSLHQDRFPALPVFFDLFHCHRCHERLFPVKFPAKGGFSHPDSYI